MRAIHLQTEYMTCPIGIDIREPRFSWNCEGGQKQTAYHIIACEGENVLWDSGKVFSSSMTQIKYRGTQLESRQNVGITLKLWDENGEPGEWTTGFFEMGLLEESDWKAKWITGGYLPRKKKRYPVDCFKKEFSASGEIKKARFYISACGLYRAWINGRQVGGSEEDGQAVLMPDFAYGLSYYQTYDVTDMLAGENTLTIELADGWFRSGGAETGLFARRTGVICQLEIFYADGHADCIVSDESFQWSCDGPLRFADFWKGEVYEAGRTPLYDKRAKKLNIKRQPVASNSVPVREIEELSGTLTLTPSKERVLDFGKNIKGFLAFRLKGKKGQEVKLTFAKELDENGEFVRANDGAGERDAKSTRRDNKAQTVDGGGGQTVRFVCSGETDSYRTSFALLDFRYVLVETDVMFTPENFHAIMVYADMEQTGLFRCSDEELNFLFDELILSIKRNSVEIPTGDAAYYYDVGAYLMNTAPLYRKWLSNLRRINPGGAAENELREVAAKLSDILHKRYADERMMLPASSEIPGIRACQRIFEDVLGIRVEGEAHFVLELDFTNKLTYAMGAYVSPYGAVKSGWRKIASGIEINFEVPPNTTAEIRLPDGNCHKVGAGQYQYMVEHKG